MAVYIAGAITIFLFYFLIMGVGVWAAKKKMLDTSEVETLNAGRRLGFFVGYMTLVGTWAGGGYFVGASEKSFAFGVLNVQVPIGLALALIIGALFYIKPMRAGNYITLIDIFQEKFGVWYGATLTIPAIMGEFFWIASVLNSLGTTLKVVIDVTHWKCVVVSAFFAGLYTILGGLTSVTYTDVLQIVFIVSGIGLAWPFMIWYDKTPIVPEQNTVGSWFGEIETKEIGTFIDHYIFLMLGSVPWQGYFQRVFSVKSTRVARMMSFISCPTLIIVAVPCLVIGAVAKAKDWTQVEGWNKELTNEDAPLVLALCLRYLVPQPVSLLGLGAVAAAVMSSADSAILASSALFTRNVYKHLFRPDAKYDELHNCLRLCIVAVTALAATLACFISSVYELSLLCADIIFVVLFPQLTMVIYAPKFNNIYGSSCSYVVAIVLRLLTGDETLGIPPAIKWPMWEIEPDGRIRQLFPFRTIIMLIGWAVMLIVSYTTWALFSKFHVLDPARFDFLRGFEEPRQLIQLAAPSKADSDGASVLAKKKEKEKDKDKVKKEPSRDDKVKQEPNRDDKVKKEPSAQDKVWTEPGRDITSFPKN